MFSFDRDLLAIYLKDHLAGSTLGVELVRRAAGEHVGTALGSTLERLAGEIESDRAALISIMDALEVPPDRLKVAVAWAGEKAGRLKLNGRIFSRSPLSAVVELEGLIAGVNGKRALWRALRAIADREPRLQGSQLDELLARAERQLDALWAAHADASSHALATPRAS